MSANMVQRPPNAPGRKTLAGVLVGALALLVAGFVAAFGDLAPTWRPGWGTLRLGSPR